MNFLKKVKSASNDGGVRAINYKKYLAEIFLAIGVIALVFIIPLSSKVYASEEFWALKAGDKTIAVLGSETEANAVIKNVKEKYVQEGALDVAVQLDPELTIEQKFYKVSDEPTVETTDEVVNKIVTGNEEVVEYTIKDGDTLWTIAEDNGIAFTDLKSINGLSDDSLIKPGDTLKLTAMQPLVNVTTVQTVTATEEIPFETTYEDNSSMAAGTTEVKTEGANGSQDVTKTITTVNGTVTSATVISSTVTKEATTEVVYKGTKVATTTTRKSSSSSKSYSYADSTTYPGSGSGVASFACQFVGNPYKYGGSSLTNGADCSGFTMAVFSHFGVSLPHGAVSQRSYGRAVSKSELQPGDLVCFSGHVGIYVGGGRMVHASNYNTGIIVTSIYYSGTPIAFRRLVE